MTVRHHASRLTVMSFADVFLMLTVLFVVLAALGIMMKRPAAAPAGSGGH